MPEYGFVAAGRDSGMVDPFCGEMSPILYRKDKYKLVESSTFWLSETPDEVSFGWGASYRRICTYAVLENIKTGERFVHVNTHLDHQVEQARRNGNGMVVEKALSFDMPVVLTGDFNYKKGCEFYGDVIESGLRDSQDIARDTVQGKTYHGYNGGEEGEPIDFIFVNSKITEVSKYRIVRDMSEGKYVSDHYPVYADMIF